MRETLKGKLAATREAIAQKQENRAAPSAPSNVAMIVTVVNRQKADYYLDFIQSFDVNMQVAVGARGTEKNGVSAYAEKAVIFSLATEERKREILDGLEEKFQTIKNGKGVSFVVPLTSVVGVSSYNFLINQISATGGKYQK